MKGRTRRNGSGPVDLERGPVIRVFKGPVVRPVGRQVSIITMPLEYLGAETVGGATEAVGGIALDLGGC